MDDDGNTVETFSNLLTYDTDNGDNRKEFDIASFPDGGFAITHQEIGSSRNHDVYLTIFNSDGSQRKVKQTFHQNLTGDQMQPNLAVLSNGNIVTAWHSLVDGNGSNSSEMDIYTATVSSAGEALTAIEKLNSEVNYNTSNVDWAVSSAD